MSQNVIDFLHTLDLNEQQIALYLTLTQKGPLTTLELARNTAVPRSTVYRLLTDLKSAKLVEEIVEEHRTLSQAVPPDRLEHLIKQKQDQINHLIQLFPQVQEYLNQQINSRQHSTQVKFYRGIDGIQQMAWNVLRAKKETVGYTQSRFAPAVGQKFAHKLFEEIYLNKLHMRDIYSDSYVQSKGGFDKLGGEVSPPFDKCFTSKYLPSNKLDVNHTMDIYNQVVAIYDWQGDDVFGVEIYNPKVAKMQKQIFEILWNMATPEIDLIKQHTQTKS